jgi:uncharacterized membrane protein YfcA
MRVTPLQLGALVASSFGAGAMNAMAGGGTILTYPTLLFLGESAIVANATSTIALWPGAAASMWGYRREVATHRHWLKTLLAPFLILFATVLFLLQGAVAKSSASHEAPPSRGRLAAALLFQLAVAVYGGYFGAGIGILMLATLGFLGLGDIHAMNGLKNFFGMCINAVAAAYFIFRGAVQWPAALVMIGGAIAGGYGGARFARRIGKEKSRAAVVVIGFGIAALLFARGLK